MEQKNKTSKTDLVEGHSALELKVKLWLEKDGKVLFGAGRLELLRALAQTGSLASAARLLNMSYRAAWGRLRASEERLGFSLVEQTGGRRSGLKLTSQAHQLMEAYERLQGRSEDFLSEAGHDLVAKMEPKKDKGPK